MVSHGRHELYMHVMPEKEWLTHKYSVFSKTESYSKDKYAVFFHARSYIVSESQLPPPPENNILYQPIVSDGIITPWTARLWHHSDGRKFCANYLYAK